MWVVKLSNKSEKFLEKISKNDREKIITFIDDLINWPFFEFVWNIKKLKGCNNTYRNRIGKYRIVFEINKKEIIISVDLISLRKDAYKK